MTIVQFSILGAFVFFIGLTVLAAKWKQTTVSNTLQDWGTKFNFFAFLWGALIGHWFFPNLPGIRAWVWLLIPIVLIAVWDTVMYFKKPLPENHWIRYPGIWIIAGLPAGAFLWGSTW